jgi:hypothetical protein
MPWDDTTFQQDRREFIKTVGAGVGMAITTPATGEASAGSSAYPDLDQLRAAHPRQGMIAPDKTYRMMEWELHTWPGETRFNMNLDAAMAASKSAGAEAMGLYTQDTWGYAFYPTDVGARRAGLKFDMFGRQAETAHRHGLSVVAYYSLQFNHRAVELHPDWAWVDAEGKPRRIRWFQTCLDTPYRRQVLTMIHEIASRYEIEEMFIDAFGRQLNGYHSGQYDDPFCYCQHTQDAWDKDHPADPYREGMKTREGWLARYRWLVKRSTLDMLDEIIAAGRQHRPGLRFAVNGGPFRQSGAVEERVTYVSEEPLPSPTGIALGSIIMRGWGKPNSQGGVFTKQGYMEIYPATVARVKADAMLVQNCRVFFVGNSPVLSGIDGQGFSKRWFQVATEAFADLREVDCLMPGVEPVCSTAVLYSESTRDETCIQRRPMDFRESTLAALETMTYAGRPVEGIPEFRLKPSHLGRFELLVLPETVVLSDEQAEIIRTWVKAGGTLIASHLCGLWDASHQRRSNFPLADVLGVDFVGEERKYAFGTTALSGEGEGTAKVGFVSTYLESSGHNMAKMLATSTVGLGGTFAKVNRTTAEEVMHYRLPLFVEDLQHDMWYNWAAPPPGPENGGPAVTLNHFGKGRALYLGVPIFWAVKGRPEWILKWLPEVIRQLTPHPIAELQAEPFSQYVHGTFFYDAGKRFVLVQLLNSIELATDGELRAAPRVTVAVDAKKLQVTGARAVYPHSEDLRLATENGKTWIEVSNLQRYAAILLKLG